MKKLIFLALLAMVSLVGCDAIKEATTYDITANNVKFDFSAITSGDAVSKNGATVMSREGAMNSFIETRTVDISEIGNSELAEYANKITKVLVKNSLLNISMNPSGEYIIENLTITAVGVEGSLVIPSYTVGSNFVGPATMNTFTTNLFKKLIRDKSVTVTVSGQTDAPTGTTVKVSYQSDVVFTASLI